MAKQALRFFKNRRQVLLENIPADRTLLELIRDDLQLKGTKEGCAEGDCGACTVVVGRLENGRPSLHAINSCIRFAHSIQDQILFTVEDLKQPDGSLHPAQQAMVDTHGSQCGFCTPGFVMSLFAMYERYVRHDLVITREQAQTDLSGNLCRCTGYRPILDAACRMPDYPKALLSHEALVACLSQATQSLPEALPLAQVASFYFQPKRLDSALMARATHPQALVVGGATDVGLWVTKRHDHYAKIIDVSRVQELCSILETSDELVLGAAVPLSRAFAVLKRHFPRTQEYLDRYAGLPIRESATLGGNIATGSPIGDSMPLLIALNARLTLRSATGMRHCAVELFYTGYRKNLLAADELITEISIPIERDSFVLAYKLSKRRDDDISIVALALSMTVKAGVISAIRIGVGGMAERPTRAIATEEKLRGQLLSASAMEDAAQGIEKEFTPISDMRASAAYRSQAIGQLLRRAWLEWSAP
ncbi:MAG: xanthine dehydrogenase small subunit [Betaproteobacteria bacterium]|nr:xanthine dehydrogenase small subunit [Betaproteobacteria bacterium]